MECMSKFIPIVEEIVTNSLRGYGCSNIKTEEKIGGQSFSGSMRYLPCFSELYDEKHPFEINIWFSEDGPAIVRVSCLWAVPKERHIYGLKYLNLLNEGDREAKYFIECNSNLLTCETFHSIFNLNQDFATILSVNIISSIENIADIHLDIINGYDRMISSSHKRYLAGDFSPGAG